MERKETFIENILMASMILLFGIVLFVVLKGWIYTGIWTVRTLYFNHYTGPSGCSACFAWFFWMYCRSFYVWSNERVLDQLYRHLPGFFDGILVS